MKKIFFKHVILALAILGTATGLEAANNKMKIDNEVKIAKNYRPFANKTEVANRYEELRKKELKLLSENATTIEIHKYQEELMDFYNRLFATIVKEDIEAGKIYTKLLGMKVKPDGSLTMTLRPITFQEALQYRVLLCNILAHGEKQPIILQALAKLTEAQINKNNSADSFFPTIHLLANDTTELPVFALAGYNRTNNTINIRKRDFLITNCFTFIHEFTHCRQNRLALLTGGLQSTTLTPVNTKEVFIPIYAENEADSEGIRHHPAPKALAESFLAKCTSQLNKTPEQIKKACINIMSGAPYLSDLECYIITCKTHALEIPKNFKPVTDAFWKKREEVVNALTLFENGESPQKIKPSYFTAYTRLFSQNALNTVTTKEQLTPHLNKLAVSWQASWLALTLPIT